MANNLERRIEDLEESTGTSEEVFPIPGGNGDVAHVTKQQVRGLLDHIAEHGRWIQVKPR
jgi:hypothetical protein